MVELDFETRCPHYGQCGGCSLQHLSLENYLAQKQNQVQQAFDDHSIKITADPILACPPQSRRRVTLSAKRDQTEIRIGFQQHRSHELVDIDQCLVALPRLVDLLPVLRSFAPILLQRSQMVQFTLSDCNNGFDLGLALETPLSETETSDLVRLLARSPFLRCAMEGDVIFELSLIHI